MHLSHANWEIRKLGKLGKHKTHAPSLNYGSFHMFVGGGEGSSSTSQIFMPEGGSRKQL
jgi:hypothetical protein